MTKKSLKHLRSHPSPAISDDDIKLFRAHVKDVRRLRNNQADIETIPKNIPKPPPNERPDFEKIWINHELDGIPGDEVLFFCRSGVQKTLITRLKRGLIAPEASLDLHGLRRDQAQLVLKQFIDQSIIKGKRFICVIHGKGVTSVDGTSVIKAVTNDFLRHHREVLAFLSAPEQNGGTGAVMVVLKRR